MAPDAAESLDLAWSDPPLEAAMWALRGGDPQPALDLLGATHREPDRRELCVEVLGGVGQRHLDRLGQVVQRDPDDGDRWLLLGASLAGAAWTVRGVDVADSTTSEQFRGLMDFTQQARAAVRRAAELSPRDPAPWSVLLGCAQGVLDYDGEQQELFGRAANLHPLLYGAHTTMVRCLTRKWYGSQTQVLEFARARTAGLPDGHPLVALIAQAHIEGYVDGAMRRTFVERFWRMNRYFHRRGVLAEIDAGSDRLLASDAYADHPRSIEAHQVYAMLYHHAEDEVRIASHLARAGTRPAVWPWAYFGDHRTEFANARRAAGLAS